MLAQIVGAAVGGLLIVVVFGQDGADMGLGMTSLSDGVSFGLGIVSRRLAPSHHGRSRGLEGARREAQ